DLGDDRRVPRSLDPRRSRRHVHAGAPEQAAHPPHPPVDHLARHCNTI
ncbi:MAG: hypothetical protein AVDCRST_MAG18-2652, partial [uncultured Thermomicrobiales bacterium]